tara:strand:- start:332 stop:556 length:225 start_codon:yes stop_codon:yes gene_type:complete
MKPAKKVQTTENRIPGILESMSSGIQLGKSKIRILLRAGYEVPDTQEKKIPALESLLRNSMREIEALKNELRNK